MGYLDKVIMEVMDQTLEHQQEAVNMFQAAEAEEKVV